MKKRKKVVRVVTSVAIPARRYALVKADCALRKRTFNYIVNELLAEKYDLTNE